MGQFPIKKTPEAAALVVGNEILSGRTQDTNTLLLIETLMKRGVRLKRWTTVPDHGPSIVSELARLVLEGFDPVFISGGMGPTHDDITVTSVAQAFSLNLVHDEGSARRMEERWSRLNPGKEMPDASREGIRKMSTIPEGFRTVPNEAGMAEGLWWKAEGKGSLIIVLPGVPKEYRAILLSREMDALLLVGESIHIAEIEFNGRESQIAGPLNEVQGANSDVEIGSYPQGPMKVIVRLTGSKDRVIELESEIRSRLERLTQPT